LDSNTDAQQLADFYESEGFVPDEGFTLDGGRMTREPNIQQQPTTEIKNESLPSIETQGNTTTIPINDNTNAEVSSIELENGSIGYEVSILQDGNINIQQQFNDSESTLDFLNNQQSSINENVENVAPETQVQEEIQEQQIPQQETTAPEGTQDQTETGAEPITEVDIKTDSGLNRAISYLESLENDLDNFGRETLGMNMPVAVAKAAISTMKRSLQTVNSMAEAIQAGMDYIRSTDWYQNLNSTEQSGVHDFFEREVLRVPREETSQQPTTKQPTETRTSSQNFQQREGKKSAYRIVTGKHMTKK